MSTPTAQAASRIQTVANTRPFAGWMMLGIAALAMVSTFPGRTFGIGLITEPLLADLALGRVQYAEMNLWATLVGAAFCLPAGKINDVWGTRTALTLTAAALGATLLYLAWGVSGATSLLVTLIFLRGFGQSALSIVSLAILGKWFTRRLALANGIFAVLISVGFAASFGVVGAAVERTGWRSTWAGIGWFELLILAPLAFFILRDPSTAATPDAADPADEVPSVTLAVAARTGRFWLYGLSSATFACLSSALLLFQEAILKELGLGHDIYLKTQICSLLFGLIFNFLGGWLGGRVPLTRLLAFGMGALAVTVGCLPLATTALRAYVYGAAMGASGGIVTVLFFTAWPKEFGRKHVGHIQGAGQLLTVVASAAGPLMLAQCYERLGSYSPLFIAAVPVCLVLAASGLRANADQGRGAIGLWGLAEKSI